MATVTTPTPPTAPAVPQPEPAREPDLDDSGNSSEPLPGDVPPLQAVLTPEDAEAAKAVAPAELYHYIEPGGQYIPSPTAIAAAHAGIEGGSMGGLSGAHIGGGGLAGGVLHVRKPLGYRSPAVREIAVKRAREIAMTYERNRRAAGMLTPPDAFLRNVHAQL